MDEHGPARADDSAAARPGLLAQIRRRREEFGALDRRTYLREE